MISSSDILNAKVLIVDNEEVSVLLLERLLRGAGYVSITSTTDPGEVCALHRSDIKTLTSPGLINRAGQLEDAGKPALYRNAVEASQNGTSGPA